MESNNIAELIRVMQEATTAVANAESGITSMEALIQESISRATARLSEVEYGTEKAEAVVADTTTS